MKREQIVGYDYKNGKMALSLQKLNQSYECNLFTNI